MTQGRTSAKSARIAVTRISSLIVAALAGACTPAFAAEIGDVAPVQIVCRARETVEKHIDLFTQYGKDAVNAQFAEDRAAGECAITPPGSSAPIEELGKARDPVKWDDGSMVRIQAVRVHGFWTVVIEPVV